MLWVEWEVMGLKVVKKLVFNNFWPFLVMDEWLSWPKGFLYWIISVSHTLGDIIG